MNDFERYLRAILGTQPVIEQIGIMTILWNRVELLWYLIYTCLLHEAPREKVDRVFQQFITGASQRQFIAALADTAFPNKPKYMKCLKKRLGAASRKIQ